jgi:hypothetical protein
VGRAEALRSFGPLSRLLGPEFPRRPLLGSRCIEARALASNSRYKALSVRSYYQWAMLYLDDSRKEEG